MVCRHNNGHVSRAEVRRVLARLGVLPTAAQVRALEARYLDHCGFSYVKLLDEVLLSVDTTTGHVVHRGAGTAELLC